MTRRGNTRGSALRKPVVVLAGEDRNDRSVLRRVLENGCPELAGRIVEINDSVRLRRATGPELEKRARVLYQKARARAIKEDAELACVFVHEDLDAANGYSATKHRVQHVLTRTFGTGHYVLAAAEVEAWLLLFPQAINAYVSSWRVPDKHRGKDTARLQDPKRVVKTELCRSGRRYQESDAPEIVAKALNTGEVRAPVGENVSWREFLTELEQCCSRHLGSAQAVRRRG